MNNAFETSDAAALPAETRTAVRDRATLLGPAYRLFYSNPVQVSSGSGALLYDRSGNEYLDAYNNVVSVGHAHPRVAEAVARQARTLATHTRYLQDRILGYSRQLLETFGGALGRDGHTMFTCTGSEANDLAARIAKHRTGSRGIIVTSDAYHGNTELTAGFSPSESSPLGAWVRCVPAPDSFRVAVDELPGRFAAGVTEAIHDLQARGDGPAALIVDSMFTSDGIYVDPAGLLAPAVDAVHRAGGLFIADEVQSGFARSGETMWGYQRHGIEPDIVTLGKPMGNGFPVACVVPRHEVVVPFGRDVSYFNTFGGNDVAIAAAQATLDVIADEGLLANADVVGRHMARHLTELATRFPRIGDIRACGLYIGVEMVTEPGGKNPDPGLATAVVNGLRERRVLISTTGGPGNVLKIRPPLVFTQAHADRLATELAAVLTELCRDG